MNVSVASRTSNQRVAKVSRPAAPDRGLSEEDVHRAVVRHLEFRAAPGVAWFHVPTGGARSRAEAGIFRALGTKAGVPDLLAFKEGKCLALELKRDKGGRVSPAQVDMHSKLRAAGVDVAVAHGLDQALETLKQKGFLR